MIPMVDLKKQYKHIKADIDAALQEVIDNLSFRLNCFPAREGDCTLSRNFSRYWCCQWGGCAFARSSGLRNKRRKITKNEIHHISDVINHAS
jgi:hypothetical protein